MTHRAVILLAAEPQGVHLSGIGLGFRHSLLGGGQAPTQRFTVVLRDAETPREKSSGFVALRRQLIPSAGFGVRARTFLIDQAELILSSEVSLLGGTTIPGDRVGQIGQHTVPARVEQA